MSCKIKNSQLFGILIVLSALIGNQSARLFGLSDGIVFKILYFSKYLVATGFLLYYIANSRKTKITRYELNKFISLSFPLFVLMLICELVALFESPVPSIYGMKYWSRSFYVMIDRVFVWVTCFCVWAFGWKNSLKCVSDAVVIDSLIIIICAIFRVGFTGIISSITSVFGGSSENFFEVHELTFCIGMLLVYYLFFCKKKNLRTKLLVTLLLIVFIIGDKRIGFAGIIVAGIFSYVVNRRGLSRKMLYIVGIMGIVASFVYLWLVYSNILFDILSVRNIGSSGRDIIFGYFTRRTEFSINQTGWGLAGINKVIENWDASEVMYMQSVSGLHNDILSVFITYGFVGSVFWFAFYLIYLPQAFYKRFSKRTATIYMLLIIYLFVTYLTDNTANYFLCQVLLLLIPLAEYSRDNNH